MTWETVIGLEMHVELLTESKLFCGCAAVFGAPPNSMCCPSCAGLPGALPSVNARAVELAVAAALALGCEVAPVSRFDRKNYFYPDLPKGYQISQMDLPLAQNGALSFRTGDVEKTVRIARLHLEEDAGTLLEIVTAPDLRGGEEAAACLEELRGILVCLGVSDGKMQEGSLRCDVNLSVRRAGEGPGTRTELKNLGSLRAVKRAAAYEAARQTALLEAGEPVLHETRRWDEDRGVTVSLRAKESVWDYRYAPEPDLPPLVVSGALCARLKSRQPELPAAKRARFEVQFGLCGGDAALLVRDMALAAFFEEAVRLGAAPKQAANWILGHVLALLAAHRMAAADMAITPQTVFRLISLVDEGAVSRNTAVKVLENLFLTGGDPGAYIARMGLAQVAEDGPVRAAAARVIEENRGAVSDYRAGKEKAFGFLVGQVMRALDGRGAPDAIARTLRGIIGEGSGQAADQ